MAANRGEIAIRIFRAATELDMNTVAVYSKEDIRAVHRYKADEAYLIAPEKGPVAAYLSIPDLIRIAIDNKVDAIHPGYGFLSESVELSRACEEAGIVFVGPNSKQLSRFGDKTQARALALEHGLPVVPGTDAVQSVEEAREFVEGPNGCNYPVIVKASMGGGGRGMRIVHKPEQLEEAINRCRSEALAAFGDGAVFVERFVPRPRHIEVQIVGDGTDVVHLFERDCSVQRRHQKVVEIAPAPKLPEDVRMNICNDAVRLAKAINYSNAGTVEFLLDPETNQHYFMEVNPRIQVEHTVTEQVTGIDLVQTQLRIASGASLADLGLKQENLSTRGYAIQCRITTEDPLNDFAPDTGRIDVWRPAGGFGIRLDSGSLHPGARVLPYYDSMLMKVTATSATLDDASRKVRRALVESRIRGVKTNIPFLLNVLRHPVFVAGDCTTRFIEENPELMEFPHRRNRANKLLRYLADSIVNGTSVVGAQGEPAPVQVIMPEKLPNKSSNKGFKNILDRQGPEAFAKAVRDHEGALLMDTTWRDAHQSLLATRVRTNDILKIAPHTSQAFQNMYSLENWGGATFDVALRFLHECPWERLEHMRELVPNIPFQMLLRGANAVGYTAYADNVIYKFCETAHKYGMDVFRVFDSLNYMDNLLLGIDAAGAAGGVVEAAICYTGDVSDPKKDKYNLDYYLELARRLSDANVHVLCIKDMAGLLKPKATKTLISALRREHPTMPIHVHTHDTSGLGVASMIAALDAGADVVDACVDSMSGMTSQPSMGAIASHFAGTQKDCGVDLDHLREINEYWESIRGLYAPFESGQKSGSFDVFEHEIPGGQYTNLHFQANSLGLASQWRSIKLAYKAANRLCGDIIKVTPSSKVVGDLAQFMVQNHLSEEDVRERAETLSFPRSVVEYFQGYLGTPKGGFPEPLRSKITRGQGHIEGRPGAGMEPMDLDALRVELHRKHSEESVQHLDHLAHEHISDGFGQVSRLGTKEFLAPMKPGEEVTVDLENGKTLLVKYLATGDLNEEGERQVFFDVNGMPRSIFVPDRKSSAAAELVARPKAKKHDPGHLGAPMPGAVVGVNVRVGDVVKANQSLVVLNAMKMETSVAAPFAGVVREVHVASGDTVSGQDLLVVIEKTDE
ncbi:uncharacterized protein MONBRDRAFT_10371 [Monosiga brevicollis MX1]|uniref:Pyruvate carboxylase n=1 Tax=Monosiga brevicollis TaxID=81824 RepID=A9V607_MONBE|nr:uncharacterized protein MONBRDRAFT_10371 [Monosiga brevicollis MX1]EDQ86990.1 predicted protein [Monosiga brevicollis MX1]|eukprot:XP_001748229.1 hypothetical protein [Monosiga brevicollis MX1]